MICIEIEINKIYNMDCLEGIKRIPDRSIDLIVTDPPYFLGMTHNGQKGNFNDLTICKPFFQILAQEFSRVLKEDGEFYIFSDWRGYAFYYPILARYLPVKNMIVWDKCSGAGNFYAYCHELIIYGTYDSRARKKGRNIWRDVSFRSGAKKTNGEKIHPTQKPIGLIQRIVTEGSKEGGTALDCFMGSGTTAIACIRSGRNYIGFELDEKYCKTAQERIEKEMKECGS